MEKFDFEVLESECGGRIDHFLVQKTELSRSRLQKLISDDLVRVNGQRVKANHRVNTGERITVELPLVKPLEAEAEDIPLDIIYEDKDLLVVNKPQGMVVHPACGNEHGTLVNALLFHCRDLSGIGGVIRPGIVHRLDKDTSGLLMVAKNDQTHLALAEQIKERSVEKIYLTLVHGRLKEDRGTIKAAIGRHPTDRKKMAVRFDGREAVTHYEVLEYLKDYSYLQIKLETGRTHQIRVHMAYINHPVVGDPVYSRSNRFHLAGQFLHAHKLSFIHPATRERMCFTVPLPDELQRVLEHLEKNK